jgi:hypothetical protein
MRNKKALPSVGLKPTLSNLSWWPNTSVLFGPQTNSGLKDRELTGLSSSLKKIISVL